MYLLLLYPLVFFWLLTRNKRKIMSLSSLVFLLYFLSSLSSLYIFNTLSKFSGIHLYISAILYHILVLLFLLYQYKSLDRFSNQKLLRINSDNVASLFTLFIIALCMICVINSIQNIGYNLSTIDVQEVRLLLIEENAKTNIWDRLSIFGNYYSLIALALAFYYMIYSPQNKFLIVLLLICSLAMVAPSLKVAGREYVIKYIFCFIIAYLLCRNQLGKSNRSLLLSFITVIGVLGVSFFIFISFLRFGDRIDYMESSGDSSMINAMLSYFGQGFLYFSAYFEEFFFPVIPIGSIHFKFFSSGSMSAYNMNDVLLANTNLNAFSTGVGSLFLDGGIFFATAIILLFVLVIRYVSRRQFNLFTFIYILWLYEFIFSFLFFFNESFTGSRVLSLLVIFLFDFIANKKNVTSIFKR